MRRLLSIVLLTTIFMTMICSAVPAFAQNSYVMEVCANNVTTYYTDFGEGWSSAVELSKEYPTILTLLSDWVAPGGRFSYASGTFNGRLYVNNSVKALTIDLNGYTIDRNLSEATDYGEVFDVAGPLTIKDSSEAQTGRITGGNNIGSGGGFNVGYRGSLYMEGGEISGNKCSGDGAGIHIESTNGVVSLTDVKITNNIAGSNAGGLWVSESEVYVGGTIVISGNKANGSEDNVHLYSKQANLNQAMGQVNGVPIAPLKEGAYVGISYSVENDVFSGSNSLFNVDSFKFFGVDDETWHYIRTAYDADGGNNTYKLYLTEWSNEDVQRPRIESVKINDSSLIKRAKFDEDNQVLTLTAVNTKKNAFNFISLDSLITYTLSSDAYYLAGNEDVCNLLLGHEYKVVAIDDTYILFTVKVVPEGGEWAAEQEEIENNYVMIVNDGDRIQSFTDFGKGWTAAVKQSKNQKTTLTLLSDWIASNGKFSYNYAADSGRLYLNDENINLIIDLNGHTISRGLTAATNDGQVFYLADGKLTIEDGVGTGKITGAYNTGDGGAFYVDYGSLYIKGGNIVDNKAKNGGAIYCNDIADAYVYIQGGKISRNTATDCGGGIFVYNGYLYIEDGEISSNTAVNGGGIYWESRDIFALTGGKITNNNAQIGAGVYIEDWGKKYVGGTIVVSDNKGSKKGTDNIYLEATDVDLNHAMGQSEGVPYAPLKEGAYIGIRSTEENDLISASDSKFNADSFKYFHGDDSNYFVRSVYDKDGGNNTHKLYYNTWSYTESKYPRVTSVVAKDENILESASINYDTQVITLNAYKHRKSSFDNISLDSLISYTLNAQDTFIYNSGVPCEITSGMEYMTMSSNGTYVMCTIKIEWVDCKHKDEDKNYVCENCGEYTLTEFKITGYNVKTKEATVFAPVTGEYMLIFADYEGNKLENVDIVEYEFTIGVNTVPQENKTFVLENGDKVMLWYDLINLVPVCDALTIK